VKKYVVLLAVLLTACAGQPVKEEPLPKPVVVVPPPPPATVLGAEKIEKMERREVIQAIGECEDAGMKPYVEYVTQRTEFGKVLVPINVHCDPKRQK
jgi:hypothetical protein